LFAGSRSIGKAAELLGYKVFSSDINDFENIDYLTDILNFDVNKVPFVPDVIWASPPCTYFSVASIGHHWNKNHTPKSNNAMKGVELVDKTIEIINYFIEINPRLKWYMENPTGKLRRLQCVRGDFDRTTITYCKYGDNRMKPTDIWSNNIYNPIFNPNGWNPKQRCMPGDTCHHELAPRGSKTGTQGRKEAYDRSKIPKELCLEILRSAAK
jgi:site-specific DNA-cytosine methylase